MLFNWVLEKVIREWEKATGGKRMVVVVIIVAVVVAVAVIAVSYTHLDVYKRQLVYC